MCICIVYVVHSNNNIYIWHVWCLGWKCFAEDVGEGWRGWWELGCVYIYRVQPTAYCDWSIMRSPSPITINRIGLFSTERGKRDPENYINNFDSRLIKNSPSVLGCSRSQYLHELCHIDSKEQRTIAGACTFINHHIYIYIYICICTIVCIYKYICIYTYMCVYIYICIYIYISICT